MNNVLDVDGLSEIFDLAAPAEMEKEPNEECEDSSATAAASGESDDYVEAELRNLVEMAASMMKTAKYVIDSCPDADTISAASSLITSMGSIIAELNKAILLKKRFTEMTKLEKLKIKARKELAKFRADNEKAKLQIGDGNTFIQNNLIEYNQEDMLKKILDAESQAQISDSSNTTIDVEKD